MVQKELRKLSQWFWKGFLKWYDGGGENRITSKRIFEIEVFFSSKNIDFPFYLKRLLEPFLHALFLEDSGVLMIFEEKITLQKHLFEWLQYTSGRRIFWNGVMLANMAKPWLWRWGCCGYIGGGRIFQSVGMHANIFGWD
jgi:hypothetical protein